MSTSRSRVSSSINERTQSKNSDWPRHVCLCRDKLVGTGAGAERVLTEQANALVERGIRCTVVLFELTESLGVRLSREVEIVVLGDTPYGDIAFFPKLLKLTQTLRKLRPDCVIAHQSLADYLRWALLGTGIPYFLLRYSSYFYLANDTVKYALLHRRSFHKVRDSFMAYTESIPDQWRAGLVRRLLNEWYAVRDWFGVRGAREVFTMTSPGQWELSQIFKIRPIVWTPGSAQANSLPAPDTDAICALRERYGVNEGQPIVLSVNRLEYRKRIKVLIDGFRLMCDRLPAPKLIIVGQGEERGALQQQVHDAHLDGLVEFAGHVSEESLAHHYQMCDVAVAIIWGSWALSVIEPLLYDKKLLISDEIPDLLEGVPNIFRVKPEPSAVARGLEQALCASVHKSSDYVREGLDWGGQMDKLLSSMRS